MSKNKGIAHERAVMFSKFGDRNLSTPIRDMICQHIGSFDPKDDATREAEAARINAIIDSSKTEAEIMEKLSKL